MRLQEMIGLSVLEVEKGKQVGKVKDFLLTETWEIQGLELEGKRLFSSTVKTVLWNDVIAYGEDAVMIVNKQAVRQTEAVDIQHTFLNGNGKVRDLPVVTANGTRLGSVTDVYFDPKMGNTMIGLEISDGFISDLMEGRRWLRYSADMKIGQDAVIVPEHCEQHLEKIITLVNG
ncbi:PRC-barrel domain-containing protein [Paenibacillus sp. CECT 9249]|uniref:PRC-barrel domain-containing protein n=1 Tax=unclassified Paenibacillus TaxID=185978 RepID=UPI001C1041BE|nr:PRC-barrel domain-containing protein [Paenibacillus sp. CECT 9249]MBU5442611.1 PRC-barrel domain-containing protein [Paenibacillus sp. MSJ-34]CAH0119065.1 hypothetical protein PAE9249_01562 [Paenibacillus sp. CECT 9249]